MKRIVFHFDVVSPFAYLAFERLPQVLQGCSYEVEYRPRAVCRAAAALGAARVRPRSSPSAPGPSATCTGWRTQHGIALDTPAVHPFNPLPLLRLALACGPNRRIVEAVFRHAWVGGHDPHDAQRLAELTRRLAPRRDPAGDEVKAELRRLTDDAVRGGIFGVPTLRRWTAASSGASTRCRCCATRCRAVPWFDGPAWDREGACASASAPLSTRAVAVPPARSRPDRALVSPCWASVRAGSARVQ